MRALALGWCVCYRCIWRIGMSHLIFLFFQKSIRTPSVPVRCWTNSTCSVVHLDYCNSPLPIAEAATPAQRYCCDSISFVLSNAFLPYFSFWIFHFVCFCVFFLSISVVLGACPFVSPFAPFPIWFWSSLPPPILFIVLLLINDLFQSGNKVNELSFHSLQKSFFSALEDTGGWTISYYKPSVAWACDICFLFVFSLIEKLGCFDHLFAILLLLFGLRSLRIRVVSTAFSSSSCSRL